MNESLKLDNFFVLKNRMKIATKALKKDYSFEWGVKISRLKREKFNFFNEVKENFSDSKINQKNVYIFLRKPFLQWTFFTLKIFLPCKKILNNVVGWLLHFQYSFCLLINVVVWCFFAPFSSSRKSFCQFQENI